MYYNRGKELRSILLIFLIFLIPDKVNHKTSASLIERHTYRSFASALYRDGAWAVMAGIT